MSAQIDIRKVAVEVRDRITDWPETHDQKRFFFKPHPTGLTPKKTGAEAAGKPP